MHTEQEIAAIVLSAKRVLFWISAAKTRFSLSNQHIKSSKNCFGGVFSKFVFPHI